MERLTYRFNDLFFGDLELFKNAFNNPSSVIFYDGDGILFNTPKVVLKRFTKETGIATNQSEIDSWDFLTELATKAGLPSDVVKHVEDGWYDPNTLYEATRYLYMKSVVGKTIARFGNSRNFVLTAREPFLTDSTRASLIKNYPEIPLENLLIRNSSEVNIGSSDFKVSKLSEMAKIAPWVILIDDAEENVKSMLNTDIKNLLVVNVPLGKTTVNIQDPRLVVIKRFPEDIQAMYPLMDAIDRVTTY